MTLGGDEDTYVLKGEDYIEGGCHAVEPEDGDITSSIVTEGEVDTSKPGDYTVTYTASSSQGYVAKKQRTVHVVESMDEQETGIPVLMYHYIYTASDVPEMTDDNRGNYLLDTDFEEQLQYLTENDFYYPSYEEVRAFIEGKHTLPKNSIVLTFDDGESGFLKYGIPMLEKYKVPATSFIICSDEDAEDDIITYASEYVSFQSHSYDMHQDGLSWGYRGIMGHMGDDEIYNDLVKAQKVLGTSDAFAYPYGYYTDQGKAAAERAGISCSFIIFNDWARIGDNPQALPRVRVSGDTSIEGFKWACTNTIQDRGVPAA